MALLSELMCDLEVCNLNIPILADLLNRQASS